MQRGTLVYLETNDAGAMLESLTVSSAFETLAEKKDFSALADIPMAIAVTSFETSEKDSTLNLKPHFVAIADTHVWSWQAVSSIENQLDNFVRKIYGATAKLEVTDKDGGKFFTWTATDNRRVFAFAENGLIYFGNDAETIEKCLAVKKGAAESLAQNESFSRAYSGNNLAFGYVSKEGITEIAALAGVSIAVNATEESDERSFIARVLPQILQNTTQEIIWTANHVEGGIEDKYSVKLKPETNSALKEITESNADFPDDFKNFLPPDIFSATRYNLKNPLIAWRGSIALTAQNTDALSGKILTKFSDKLLEPYGIAQAEAFLEAVAAPIITVQFDADGEKSVTIATVKNLEKLKDSILKEIDFKSLPMKQTNAEIWFSEDKSLAAAVVENKIFLGDGESVLKCLAARQTANKTANNPAFQRFTANRSVAVTFGTDVDSAEKIGGVLGNPKTVNRKLATFYTTETRLTDTGFERVTVSDFGFIGTLLNNLN